MSCLYSATATPRIGECRPQQRAGAHGLLGCRNCRHKSIPSSPDRNECSGRPCFGCEAEQLSDMLGNRLYLFPRMKMAHRSTSHLRRLDIALLNGQRCSLRCWLDRLCSCVWERPNEKEISHGMVSWQ